MIHTAELSSLAESQQLTVDEVIASALAAQLAGWERLQLLAERGTKAEFLAVLAKLPTSSRNRRTGSAKAKPFLSARSAAR
jgi:hypothetical protein